jgi:hypothetical protein
MQSLTFFAGGKALLFVVLLTWVPITVLVEMIMITIVLPLRTICAIFNVPNGCLCIYSRMPLE